MKYSPLDHEYEGTYVDLFILSISDKIVMSQKHSNFSVFVIGAQGSFSVYKVV